MYKGEDCAAPAHLHPGEEDHLAQVEPSHRAAAGILALASQNAESQGSFCTGCFKNINFYTDCHSGRGILFLPCPQKAGVLQKNVFNFFYA